ncbi:MAG: hypothetical protein CVU41_18145 [Chloroflexi bacterium HGW-Chloroflexi-3]|nr:MAG: hypothetical protein CVU41_18145 [Chloroflexi bacterium HGW-Chloroflexi-3]
MTIKPFRNILYFLPIMIVLAGCGVKPSTTKQFTIQEPLSNANPISIDITMGGGNLQISSSEEPGIYGLIENNTEKWQPDINQGSQQITISQTEISKFTTIPSQKFINRWDLKMNGNPLDLFIEGRAYKGSLDLTDIALKSFKFLDSVSDTEVVFNKPNPVKMETFEIGSAGSNLKLSGLSNANFSQLNFRGAGGKYTLNFSGTLQQDSKVTIISGLGFTRVEIPKNIPATVIVNGIVRGLNVQGPWEADQNTYKNTGSGFQLFIEINMDMGTLELILQ